MRGIRAPPLAALLLFVPIPPCDAVSMTTQVSPVTPPRGVVLHISGGVPYLRCHPRSQRCSKQNNALNNETKLVLFCFVFIASWLKSQKKLMQKTNKQKNKQTNERTKKKPSLISTLNSGLFFISPFSATRWPYRVFKLLTQKQPLRMLQLQVCITFYTCHL